MYGVTSVKRLVSLLLSLSLAVVLTACTSSGDTAALETEAPVAETSAPSPTPSQETTAAPEPTLESSSPSNGDLLKIAESGYGIVLGKYVYYSISILNQSDDSAVRSSSFRVTARDADGLLLATTDQLCSIVYPQRTLVLGGQAFPVDEAPATVDFEIISPKDHNIVNVSELEHPDYIPLEVANFTRRDTGLVGEVVNKNDYDIESVVVSVVYRDADGNICGGDDTYVNDVKAGSSAPFSISEYSDFEEFDYELYASTRDS